MPTFNEENEEREVAKLHHKEEEETVKLLAERFGMTYADLSIIPVNVDALAIVREEEAREAELAVIQKIGKKLDIAIHNPENQAAQAVLQHLAADRYAYDLVFVSKTSLKKAWEFYAVVRRRAGAITGEVDVSADRIAAFRAAVNNLPDIAKLLTGLEQKRTTDILEIIIAGSLETDASDIHLEPQADHVRLRYRLDGVLNDAANIPSASYQYLLSRVKLIAEMKLNIQTRGQDGRFTIHVDNAAIEVRASVLPGPYGENIVLRILNPKNIAVSFRDLGMQPWIQAEMARELAKPNGMIVTTGPTGSGKTTTLYAFLREVHKPGTKIITLEDPIEYHIAGMEQTQIHAESGYDFPSGLRSILRQDPDVILVGEMRDFETAHTAMNAALTGHLVFSTLHTNNAAGTIPRLIDLNIEPAIIAPAINVAMAQRLVRKLCEKCKTAAEADAATRAAIEAELAGLPKQVPKPTLATPLMLPKAIGCEACHTTGYKGRIGVFEVILIDDSTERLVFKKPSEVEMKQAMHEQGQITMRQDGALKVLAGVTDFPEVERVVGET